MTTFYETGRSSLNEEINLYIEFLKQTSLKDFDILILKSHPGNEKEKIKKFTNRVLSDGHFKSLKIIYNKFKENVFPIERIPLEILVAYLNTLNNKEVKINICITCSSTATLSTKLIIEDCEIKFAFGEKIIKKYLYKEFVQKRLIQENYLLKEINKIIY